jgi:hypothetical protein
MQSCSKEFNETSESYGNETTADAPKVLQRVTVNWGYNHPDFAQGKTKRARWSDDELQYLSKLIEAFENSNTCTR